MKKLLLLFLVFSLSQPSYAWWWDKVDKKLEAELKGKGYAGTLPDITTDIKSKQKKVVTPIFESKYESSNV